MSDRSAKGRHAEDLALAHLVARGLKPVTRNYRCRYGEIDLIMRHRDCTVFVEVRSRRSLRFGNPAESIDRHKQRRIAMTAAHYLQTHAAASRGPARFDVVALIIHDDAPEIDWIPDAYQLSP